jgi:hypothetical protein
MTNKIEARVGFDLIKNDQIEFFKAMKEHALNYEEKRYSMAINLESWRTLLNSK